MTEDALRVARTIASLREVLAREPEEAALLKPAERVDGHWNLFDPDDIEPVRPTTDTPLVTVVTVCKDAANYLPRAIASVQAQDYPNIEYIIQDGGSSDDTALVVEANGLLGGFVSEPDLCTLDGLLRAARRAQGQCIAVCWADDELLPHSVTRGVSQMSETGADVIYGDEVFARNTEAHIIRSAPWNTDRFLQGEFFPSFASSLYRRDILLKLGERLTTFDHDEWEYWALLGQMGNVQYVPRVAAIFHVHDKTRWVGAKAATYVAQQVEGRKRAIAELALSAEVKRRAEMGAELWAALHLTSWADDALAAICDHTERALELANGDYRFELILNRLEDIHQKLIR